ncbi:Lrp/AsnC family transcriptional regulator [Halapricum hydrolyticum]|uniref:Lrp/AsnC family transcriptional regulator n=1 Tax=Halapricum hydrolyticum TaxID=2979991 RepID=A0AAE3IAG8_9EURY|nr:Lrp/AsnC family transcriptional regulator [Halapricum hydrolyticum]MCU4717791.1 Lrp/AsnC family transcriptional regulator [Halapricum hydrolyticum]MCU4726955.1 Lrp/AsnC family transcriptional regulator [Halapricum hydrolyticum]
MDERDIRILKAIADLGTGSPDELHEETGIPVSTIHYRLGNLREEGIIENDLYDFDLSELGLDVTVLVEVLSDYSDDHEDVLEKLREVEGVTQIFSTMGETDFIAIARLPGSDAVERLIRDFEMIEEVDRTNSTYVISTDRDFTRGIESYDLETLVETLVEE